MVTGDPVDAAGDDDLAGIIYSDGGLNEGKTPIESFERAAELAASLRAKVTLAAPQRDARFDEKRGPTRYVVHLWNWQTRRGVDVRYEEDLRAALKYVGRLDPSKRSAPDRLLPTSGGWVSRPVALFG